MIITTSLLPPPNPWYGMPMYCGNPITLGSVGTLQAECLHCHGETSPLVPGDTMIKGKWDAPSTCTDDIHYCVMGIIICANGLHMVGLEGFQDFGQMAVLLLTSTTTTTHTHTHTCTHTHIYNQISSDQRITSGWRRSGEYSHFLKDSKIPICLKRKIMDTAILPVMTYRAETWSLTKLQERKMAVAQQSMERELLNIMKRDKIRYEVIRSKTNVVDIIDKVQCIERTVGRTYHQNEQHQVGQDNIRVDTQRRKTSKRKT